MDSNLPTSPETVTRLLDAARRGVPGSLDELLPLVYAELHRVAARQMAGERPDHTLQPTALINEAVLRLLGDNPVHFQDRTHFIRTAAQAMRRVLVDHARARNAAKRGTSLKVTLDDAIAGAPNRIVEMLVLDDALNRLADADPRWAQVVELRFFGGLEVPEVAATLGVSVATVKRDWQFAKAWLARELRDRVDI